jgi:multidrug resistance efflux pump
MTVATENRTEAESIADTEKEIERLKSDITNKQAELDALQLELGRAAIKLENQKGK